MTPAERRRVARVLREEARIVAEYPSCIGLWETIVMLPHGSTRTAQLNSASDAIEYMFPWPQTRLPFDKSHRHLHVMLLLFVAEAVLTGDCDD